MPSSAVAKAVTKSVAKVPPRPNRKVSVVAPPPSVQSLDDSPPDADEAEKEQEKVEEMEELEELKELEEQEELEKQEELKKLNEQEEQDEKMLDAVLDGEFDNTTAAIVPKEPTSWPAEWKDEWDKPLFTELDEKFKKFRFAPGNKTHALPQGLEFCKVVGVNVGDSEEDAAVVKTVILEMRATWKKINFPRSKRQNDVPFAEFEASVWADLTEVALGRFEEQAKLHDAGHKPENRLAHWRAAAKTKRTNYETMRNKRLDNAEKNRKERKEAAAKRQREAPERKKKERDTIAEAAVEKYKEEQKTFHVKIKDEMKRLMKEDGLSVEDAIEKATSLVLGF